jgi:hypothetical protein
MTQIRYTATIDTNPFAAGSQRMGAILSGMRAQQAAFSADLRGHTDAARAQIAVVADSVRDSVVAMGGHFSGLLQSVGNTRTGFVALTAAAAGLAAAKAAQFAAQMTEATMDLGRVLGSTTNEAQRWRIAAEDVGATQSDLEAAAKGMAKQLKENEEQIKALGLRTRDAQGHLRPMTELLADGLVVLNGYEQGAERALAATDLFGRGVDSSSKLLLMNNETLEEAQKTVKELGLEVGANAVKAWGEYDGAVDRAGFSLKGMANTVGQIVLPVITDLINVFNGAMPAAITVVKGAVGGLATAYHSLKNGIVIVWEVMNAWVVAVAEPIRAMFEGVGRALVGDFSGAAAVIKNVPTVISGAWASAMASMLESSQATRARIGAIWGEDTEAGIPVGASGNKKYKPKPDKPEEDKTGKGKATDEMATYEAVLAEERRIQTLLNDGREYTKEQEISFWRAILDTYEPAAKARTAIVRKMADLEVAILREKAKQREQIDAIGLKAQQDRALAAVELAQQDAQAQLALGDISKAQMLDAERAFEGQRLGIKLDYLRARLAVIDPDRDPVAYAQASEAIEEAERQHQQRMAQIRQGAEALKREQSPMLNIWNDAQQAMAQAAGQILTRQQSLAQGLKNIWQGIRQSIAGEITKIAAEWLKGMIRQRVLTMAGIGMKAAEAGAGAAASQASIPIVGPALALAAMGATMAAVLGLGASVPSAARGWDIPAGINPITQLHEQEMVLPADQANVIRDLAAGGGGGVAQPAAVLRTVGTMGDFLMVHRHDLAKVIKVLNKDSLRG